MLSGKSSLRCGLIGEKLSHSFSPQIHKELADYSYSLFEMKEEEVEAFLKSNRFDAINVTIPYKKTVMPYLSEISDEAKRIGSVNTITRLEGGGLRGDNTDYYGFWHTLEKSGISPKGKNVLILGTGGASLTARTVSADMGARSITFVSRTGEVNYENVYLKCPDTEIVINCTPVGMYPNNGISPIDPEKLPKCQGVVDMIYNPAKTQLLLDAERLRIPHVNGLPMLVAQAKRACELFLNQPIADTEVERITAKIAAEMGNIILVGMPGCGKTTVGTLLAEMTGREILDTDEMIRHSTGRSPSEIIVTDGEPSFRRIEADEIKKAGKQSGKIISTGGGAVTVQENYLPLHQNGTVVFIHRALENLATADRPLSKNLSELYAKRLPLYRNFCDLEVSNDASAEDCAKEILQKLKGT